MSFTGDAETIRFKTLLASVFEMNELAGKSAYALYFATKKSDSGWSFGVPQYDLGSRNQEGIDLFRRILQNPMDQGRYIIDDGDPKTDRLHDRKVDDLVRRAQIKGGSSLSPHEVNDLINKALSSTYGMSAIDGALDSTQKYAVESVRER
jgi:hypothetical protein